MTFQDYVTLISDSVADSGYDQFYPSMCGVGDAIRMRVLECELSETGEEQAAKEWVAEFADESEVMYLAYRVGKLKVHICEIRDRTVVNKHSIQFTLPATS